MNRLVGLLLLGTAMATVFRTDPALAQAVQSTALAGQAGTSLANTPVRITLAQNQGPNAPATKSQTPIVNSPAGSSVKLSPPNVEVSVPATQQFNSEERAQSSPTRPRYDPFPIEAAGWSRPRSEYFYDSHWEEDWTTLQKAGKAPPFKAMPLFGNLASLTLSMEERLRVHYYGDGQLAKNNNYTEFQNRLLVGADLHITPYFRIYSELGDGALAEHGNPNVQSVQGKQFQRISLQQEFGELNYHRPGLLLGGMIGRMEWTDAPEQLVSIGNGPNLLQTWNGYRAYLHTDWLRLGWFRAYPTQQTLGTGNFQQYISHEEWIRAITASIRLLNAGPRYNMFLTPLYITNYVGSILEGSTTGRDHRYTWGGRLQGRLGSFTVDWMGYGQTGDHIGRPVSAWLTSDSTIYKVPSLPLPVDVGFRFDAASGGGGLSTKGPTHLFDPIYTDKGIYGEIEIFTYQNIMNFAPLTSIRITPTTRLNLEYDIVYRENTKDAFYTPGKAYANTGPGRDAYAGGQVRFNLYQNVTRNIFLRLEADYFHAGKDLTHANLADGYVIMPDITIRY